MSNTIRVGKLVLSPEMLAELLGYPGGTVHHLGVTEDKLDRIFVIIKHPDMPELPVGGVYPEIEAMYRTETVIVRKVIP